MVLVLVTFYLSFDTMQKKNKLKKEKKMY